jgi:hypothetical protein
LARAYRLAAEDLVVLEKGVAVGVDEDLEVDAERLAEEVPDSVVDDLSGFVIIS